eukprot:6070396-Pleurochrysis_carterae.AAC.1
MVLTRRRSLDRYVWISGYDAQSAMEARREAIGWCAVNITARSALKKTSMAKDAMRRAVA